MNTIESIRARFLVDEETGCLLWTGACLPNGYGVVRVGGKQLYVHRFMWESAHGPIPKDKQIHHACRTRRCGNSSHLSLVTPQENIAFRFGFSLGPNEPIMFRLSSEMKAQCQATAAKAHMPMSEWVRDAMERKLKSESRRNGKRK